ncbi:hypothetical protein CCP3SC1AL1_150012 [Gammaproteobacteria bacterium]
MELPSSVFSFLARKAADLLKKSEPGTLTGTVRDFAGRPVFGVEVTAGGKTVCTAKSGRYAIGDLPPSVLQIDLSYLGKTETNIEQTSISAGQKLELNLELPASLDPSKYNSVPEPIQIQLVPEIRTALDPVPLAAPAPPPVAPTPALPLPPLPPAEPGSITGFLRDSDGNPVIGVEVIVGKKSARTAKSGKYAIVDLPPNTYNIDLSFGDKTEKNIAQALIQSEQTLEKDLRLPIPLGGAVTGIVRDSAGNPVVGAEVIIGSRKTLTGKPGKYALNDLPISTLQIDLSLGDKTEKKVEEFSIQVGQVLEKNLRLPISLGGAITGVVRGSDGGPLPRIIEVFAGGKTVPTDNSGKYRITDLPPGLVQIDLLYFDQKESNVEQLLVKLGQTLEQDLVCSMTALIHGRYFDHGDGTVTDMVNQLRWKRCCEGQTWDGKTCVGEATKYTWNNLPKPSNGWRVPTVKEANTLLYCGSTGEWGDSLVVPIYNMFDTKSSRVTKFFTVDRDVFADIESLTWTSTEYQTTEYQITKYACDQYPPTPVKCDQYPTPVKTCATKYAWVVYRSIGRLGPGDAHSLNAVRVVSSSQ